MARHNRNLSFTSPILVSFTGILFSFILIAFFITYTQRADFLEDYHGINRNFTHNLAVNYTESLLRENEYVLGRATTFFSRNNQLDEMVNEHPDAGLKMLMQLQTLLPTVSSIFLLDTEGHYLRVPKLLDNPRNRTFDIKTRPWYMDQAEVSTFSRYSPTYLDYFTHNPTVTIYKPIISPEGQLKGSLAFQLDLTSMGYTLRQMVAPVQGEFFVVDRDGKVVIHPDTGALFKQYVSKKLMNQMTNGDGYLYDPNSQTWYYYYSFTNPDWFIIYRVSKATLLDLTRHETNIVAWGFALAAIMIALFGLYLRHASRTVLMNIINAIKTGDVKRAPRLEAMLSRAIESNKERQLAYARQATIDALTGCKNRRAFDNDIAALMNEHQPFTLALIDIDNFKSINDTWGHLTGDIVLRNVAREGIEIMQPAKVDVYRYGGEEFAVLFTGEQLKNAFSLLEHWRVQIAERTWLEEKLHVTFSAGMCEWNLETQEQLIVRADKALYNAKQQGKNRIVMATP